MTPTGGLTSSGLAGGPFTPSSRLTSAPEHRRNGHQWDEYEQPTWTTLSAASGTLAAGATATVTVTINTGGQPAGRRDLEQQVTFANMTNGSGTTTRPVTSTVSAPGALRSRRPAPSRPRAWSAVRSRRRPGLHAPERGRREHQLDLREDPGMSSVPFASGTLAVGATATVTVTINTAANALAAGTFNDTVTFTNTTNGSGNQTTQVALQTVVAPGVLAVTPAGGLTSRDRSAVRSHRPARPTRSRTRGGRRSTGRPRRRRTSITFYLLRTPPAVRQRHPRHADQQPGQLTGRGDL